MTSTVAFQAPLRPARLCDLLPQLLLFSCLLRPGRLPKILAVLVKVPWLDMARLGQAVVPQKQP